jgi:hypothetical protein
MTNSAISRSNKENLENSPSFKLATSWSKFHLNTPEKAHQTPNSSSSSPLISPQVGFSSFEIGFLFIVTYWLLSFQTKHTTELSTTPLRKRKEPDDISLSYKQILSSSTVRTEPSKPPSKRLKIHSEHELNTDRIESYSSSTAFVLGGTTTTCVTSSTKIGPSSLKSTSHLTSIPPTSRESSKKKRIVKLRDAVLARTSKINCSLRRTFSASFGLTVSQYRPSFCDTASSQPMNRSNSSTQEKNSFQREKTNRSISVRTIIKTTTTDKPNTQQQNRSSPAPLIALTSQAITETITNTSTENAHSSGVQSIKTTQNCNRKYVIHLTITMFLQSQLQNYYCQKF